MKKYSFTVSIRIKGRDDGEKPAPEALVKKAAKHILQDTADSIDFGEAVQEYISDTRKGSEYESA